MEDSKNDILFDDMSFSDLMKDIYENSKNKREKIDNLVNSLSNMVNNMADATIAAPLIKQYLEVGVKNDEHLVKLAAVIQRHSANSNKSRAGDDMFLLSEEEKVQLLEIANGELKQLNKG
jgi:hypothetical protein